MDKEKISLLKNPVDILSFIFKTQMKFICRIIEKTKLFPLTVMSLYYMKTFLLYSMWSTFTA